VRKARLRSGLFRRFGANFNAVSLRATIFSGGTVPNSGQAQELSRNRTFGIALPNFMMEAVLDQSQPNQLRLHSWDGRKAATTPTISYRGCTYTAAPLQAGLSRKVFQARVLRSEQRHNWPPRC
jgi:hypothetical protein